MRIILSLEFSGGFVLCCFYLLLPIVFWKALICVHDHCNDDPLCSALRTGIPLDNKTCVTNYLLDVFFAALEIYTQNFNRTFVDV
jgi:hypothetical protein